MTAVTTTTISSGSGQTVSIGKIGVRTHISDRVLNTELIKMH